MKPYIRVIYNLIRITCGKKLQCRGLYVNGIQMIGFNTKLSFHKNSIVKLGDRIVSDGRLVIMTGDNAELKIGNRVYFNEDTMISCKSRIIIGAGCRFGPGVKIFDNDHKFDAIHGVSAEHISEPIFIGENCWIGSNAVILKGARIGKNCVIGAGCIVSGDIPDSSIVTQNRDLVIRPIRK